MLVAEMLHVDGNILSAHQGIVMLVFHKNVLERDIFHEGEFELSDLNAGSQLIAQVSRGTLCRPGLKGFRLQSHKQGSAHNDKKQG